MNRKFRKLLRDPKLFFRDMYNKRSIQIKKYIPVKYNGTQQYTVVSAVYNVEKYLNDYFSSLTKQSLNFKKHIQLILVDDGSTDRSAEIIKRWQAKFPKNIHYFYKENGGQASARNLGLQHVETEWVTFIDPDDFVSSDYFYKTDNFLSNNANISIIGCPLVFYFEDKDMVKDTHPLKYRFAKGDVVLPLSNLKDHLQLSASTAFFKIDNIRNAHIYFDEAMKPSFEDAKFVTDYILNTDASTNAAFLSKISYFYRKRSDGSSTLDGAWNNPLLFSRVIEKGCIEILKTAKMKFEKVPEHIQRIVLYHIIWYFGRIVNKPAALSHLSEEQKKHFVTLLHEMFSYIDEATILRFNLAGTWFFQKVALLGLFKNTTPKNQIAYIEDFDLKKKQILVKYFSNFPIVEQWVINGKEIFLIYEPMAAAIGIGLDIMQAKGNMIIDIGGGTAEIAVISLGGIVCDKSVKIAGDVFTNDIIYYMRTRHNLYIGETTAENIKINTGAAIEDIDSPPDPMLVQGRDLLTGKPKQVEISHREVAKALDKSILRIEDAIMETLSQTPPELAADIYNTGIYMAGGGSMLRGLDKRISMRTDLPVYVAEDPLRAVVRGTGITLKNIEKFRTILMK